MDEAEPFEVPTAPIGHDADATESGRATVRAVLGLGLCNTRAMMSPDQLAALDRDLAELAKMRHISPPDIGVN